MQLPVKGSSSAVVVYWCLSVYRVKGWSSVTSLKFSDSIVLERSLCSSCVMAAVLETLVALVAGVVTVARRACSLEGPRRQNVNTHGYLLNARECDEATQLFVNICEHARGHLEMSE